MMMKTHAAAIPFSIGMGEYNRTLVCRLRHWF